MRLQKYLADAGVASRRKCETFILDGRAKVNGKVITELGVKVEEGDSVEFDGKLVKLIDTKYYYMLNKPVGYITSVTDDRGRKTVLDLLPDNKHRVYPVGRLDYKTSGILLLTNDGDFAYKLTHPKHIITKTYIVKVEGILSDGAINELINGVQIYDYVTKPAKVAKINQTDNSTTLQIVISEGKNRQIRKMCNAVGADVLSLKRVAIGNITLNDLPIGKMRPLTADEIKHFQ
ncbi:MAG: pseudouridine synthase [Epulopiscium sp. Nuni2H_MBin003]|nr:MAG: pseudouridine synthase [Epulopiscium sp. Nuni2H_MBin003]